ncbi:MAG: hypothetical protein E7143_03530 [Rikenellaceae bacterium]|nr:hypothetical protein [Rikenellaceae bacterium]
MSFKNLLITYSDCPTWVTIDAEIDVRKRLIITYNLESEESPSRDFTRRATVDSEDTLLMAKHYRVSTSELPEVLYRECGYGEGASPSDADGVFKGALDMILDAGVHYKLEEF